MIIFLNVFKVVGHVQVWCFLTFHLKCALVWLKSTNLHTSAERFNTDVLAVSHKKSLTNILSTVKSAITENSQIQPQLEVVVMLREAFRHVSVFFLVTDCHQLLSCAEIIQWLKENLMVKKLLPQHRWHCKISSLFWKRTTFYCQALKYNTYFFSISRVI